MIPFSLALLGMCVVALAATVLFVIGTPPADPGGVFYSASIRVTRHTAEWIPGRLFVCDETGSLTTCALSLPRGPLTARFETRTDGSVAGCQVSYLGQQADDGVCAFSQLEARVPLSAMSIEIVPRLGITAEDVEGLVPAAGPLLDDDGWLLLVLGLGIASGVAASLMPHTWSRSERFWRLVGAALVGPAITALVSLNLFLFLTGSWVLR